jgi:lipopolysaccharide/colanic/teichoic acid biosynthesis glycosyltransferase
MIKRAFDIVVSLICLVALSPVMLITGLLALFSMGFPVLYRQVRPGLHGAPFEMIKFRTMANLTDSAGNLMPDAQRLTPVGVALRKTSLDELPELWNVLRGDMSLVGPRPLLMEYLPLYTKEQARRHDVRPGITGWAQVNGRNTVDWGERFRMDVWYVDNQSLWLDLKILWLTVWSVLGAKGVSQDGHATCEKFRGDAK